MTTTAPVIRALLLTDLCDSVQLVERIGDQAAAALFQAHDTLVLKLQQRWNGQLIDRSDGMLLVFERPLHAVGFALDYQAELDALGASRDLLLRARAGLHVGEVHFWRNSDEAVRAGAKPLEVEGLAKPMAARLMAMARPGQVLVSSVAEALVRRAAQDELASLRGRLVWEDHGRWQLRGVALPQQVYEVGEAGTAPLRTPLPGPKARRLQPWWRWPLVLAAQALLLGVLGGAAWYATRGEPAVAFAQRDWLVLASLESEHPDASVREAVEKALRIALEQSSYLNLIGEAQVRESLALSGQPESSALRRELALAVAQREGARVVIVPVLERKGTGWAFALELVDPASGRTLRKAEARASDDRDVDLLGAVDEAVRSLRAHLGEAIDSIEDSEPLPRVTTGSLPALRAFALAEKAAGEGDFNTAAQLFGAALEADPEFALAHMGQARLLIRLDRIAEARLHMHKAMQHRDRLPLRERLYLDAWSEELSPRGWALERWEALARLFPDFAAGPANASWYLLTDNRFAAVVPYARSVGYSRHPMRGVTLMTLARAQLGLGEHAAALATLADLEALNKRSSYLRGDVLAALGREPEAVEVMQETVAGGDSTTRFYGLRGLVSTGAGSGDCGQMRRYARLMQDEAGSQPSETLAVMAELYVLQSALCGHPAALSGRDLQQLATRIEHNLQADARQGPVPPAPHYLSLLAVAYLGLRGGQPQLAERILERHQAGMAQNGHPAVVKLLSVVHARRLLEQGRAQQALDHLSSQLDGAELYQARVVMRDAYRALGQDDGVPTQQAWLRDQAGRAWAEVIGGQQLQPLNVLDLAAARERAAPRAPAVAAR